MVEVNTVEETVSPETIIDAKDIIAKVRGEAFTELPQDLYIPPEALQVFLEAFEGPLDLLLYLIRKQNMDILDIPVAQITTQYMEYVELMKEFHLELAAEYLVMAAMLAEIKSRLLLPRPPSEEATEEDPRTELMRRLQEYERYKKAAEDINALPQEGIDYFISHAQMPPMDHLKPLPQVLMKEITLAIQAVLQRAALNARHQIQLEPISIRERMVEVLRRVKECSAETFLEFSSLFNVNEGRVGVVVTFIAVLELLKQSLIDIVQNEPFSPLHVKAKAV